MRTTIRIDERLLREAKARAAESGRTLNAVVEEALRAALARRERGQREPFLLPAFTGSRLQPGVVLDDSASLLDLIGDTTDRDFSRFPGLRWRHPLG